MSATLPDTLGDLRPDEAPRKVLMAPELMVAIAEAASGHRVTVDWGEPDADGFYTPTITTHEEGFVRGPLPPANPSIMGRM